VVEFNKTLKPDPHDSNIIDQAPREFETIPPKRGPGRPKGSKNKPKTVDAEELFPFVAAKTTDGGGSGEPL
jgi:hypothetical protein